MVSISFEITKLQPSVCFELSTEFTEHSSGSALFPISPIDLQVVFSQVFAAQCIPVVTYRI